MGEGNSIQELSDDLLDIVSDEIFIFLDQDGKARVIFENVSTKKPAPVNSKITEICLRDIYYRETNQTISSEPLNRVMVTLEMFAKREGTPTIPVHPRMAQKDGKLFYNLDNKTMVVVSKNNVAFKNNAAFKKMSEKKFIFAESVPQIQPNLNASADKLLRMTKKLFRAKKDPLLLLTVWLCACFIQDIYHPILILHGKPGCSKSTTFRALGRIIDPNKSDLLTMPNDRKNLVSTLSNRYLSLFDNIRTISKSVSDLLCNAVTGGYESMRTLYTTNDNTSVSVKGCVGVNGVECVATQPDLLDRAILIDLQRIPADKRLTNEDYWTLFDELLPDVLGSIFRTLQGALKLYNEVTLPKHSRMADFEKWGYCIAESIQEGLGDEFLKAYNNNQDKAKSEYRTHVLVTCLVDFMKNQTEWKGRTNELYHQLEKLAPSHKRSEFPNNPTGMSRILKDVTNDLDDYGITYHKFKDTNGNASIKICKAQNAKNSNMILRGAR